jgi:ABC-2 type transport system permease protein
MHVVTPILTVAIKELREVLRRPWQALVLIFGPLAMMILFGVGSNATPRPPRAIVVLPAGQDQPRLLQDYQRQFDKFLSVVEYTYDEVYARAQLDRYMIEAVVILPPAPYQTIAEGRQATIRVLYNQIDPLWRAAVPNFVQVLANEINRGIFVQNLGSQQAGLTVAAQDIDLLETILDIAITTADQGDRAAAREHVQAAENITERMTDTLSEAEPSSTTLRSTAERLGQELQEAERRLAEENRSAAPADTRPLSDHLGLTALRDRARQLKELLEQFTSVRPEVLIAPIVVETRNTARLTPDIVTFFAPSVLALLIQHLGVSLGALAIVRERLVGSFELYTVAPISTLELLLGKYLAQLLFTLLIAAAVVITLLSVLEVPLLGSPWRLTLIVMLLAIASVGLGLLLSLIATSEHQAVQFAMLALLGVVFFSGFTLPLETLRAPARVVSYLLPATYGISLLQDVMLRGGPGSHLLLLTLAAIGVTLFGACLGLLIWRTRAP